MWIISSFDICYIPICCASQVVGGGQVYGATDEKGAHIIDRKVSIPDFNATIGWALGLPLEEKFTASSGEQFQIAADGEPVTGLFA